MVPSGVIVVWHSSIASVPKGWAFCDGTRGTPDLRNVTVVGAGGQFVVNASDANPTHRHGVGSVSIPNHTHTISTHVGAPVYRGNVHVIGVTTDHDQSQSWGDMYEKNRFGIASDSMPTSASGGRSLTGNTEEAVSMPPYRALAHIMKL